MTEKTVQVSVPRRLLWEMRTRYDEATVDNMLRLIYCAEREMAYGAICGAVTASFFFVFIIAAGMPGPVQAQWPSLVPVGMLAVAACLRTYRSMLPYGRTRLAIQNSDPDTFHRIMEELASLEKECRKGQYETATVSLRL